MRRGQVRVRRNRIDRSIRLLAAYSTIANRYDLSQMEMLMLIGRLIDAAGHAAARKAYAAKRALEALEKADPKPTIAYLTADLTHLQGYQLELFGSILKKLKSKEPPCNLMK